MIRASGSILSSVPMLITGLTRNVHIILYVSSKLTNESRSLRLHMHQCS